MIAIHVAKHQHCKRHVLVRSMIFKCSQETLSTEKVVKIKFQSAECLVVKSLTAVMYALEAAMKALALNAR